MLPRLLPSDRLKIFAAIMEPPMSAADFVLVSTDFIERAAAFGISPPMTQSEVDLAKTLIQLDQAVGRFEGAIDRIEARVGAMEARASGARPDLRVVSGDAPASSPASPVDQSSTRPS